MADRKVWGKKLGCSILTAHVSNISRLCARAHHICNTIYRYPFTVYFLFDERRPNMHNLCTSAQPFVYLLCFHAYQSCHAYRTDFHILLESSAFILQAVIKNADMAEDMQQDAIDCATQVGMTDVPSLEIGLKAVETVDSQMW